MCRAGSRYRCCSAAVVAQWCLHSPGSPCVQLSTGTHLQCACLHCQDSGALQRRRPQLWHPTVPFDCGANVMVSAVWCMLCSKSEAQFCQQCTFMGSSSFV